MTDRAHDTFELVRWCRESELRDARSEQRWPTCYQSRASGLVETRITFDWSKP